MTKAAGRRWPAFLAAAVVAGGVAAAHGQAVAPGALPAAIIGDWRGTLHIRPTAGKAQEVPMELHVAPVRDGKAYRWQIVYGAAGSPTRQVRDYELIPDPKRPGHFTLDEKNGILLDADLVGGALCSAFRVGANLLVSRYESPAPGRLRFEIAVYRAGSEASETKATPPPALPHPLVSTQTADLTPIPPAAAPT